MKLSKVQRKTVDGLAERYGIDAVEAHAVLRRIADADFHRLEVRANAMTGMANQQVESVLVEAERDQTKEDLLTAILVALAFIPTEQEPS